MKTKSRVRCWQVDAFTDRPFAGNPAAVCWLEEEADPQWMQSVAAEMNHSETAFVRRHGDDFGLRWFTPTVEVDLCGHATLATAHCCLTPYWAERLGKNQTMAHQCSTRGGVLRLRLEGDRVILGGEAVTVWQGELL